MRPSLRLASIVWCFCFACGSSSGGAPAGQAEGDAGSGTDGMMMAANPDSAAGTDSATGTDSSSGGADSSSTDSGGADGMMASGIPAPGSSDMVDQNFGDVEPNDTPQQATPLGTAMAADVNVWVDDNSIGGTNLADYFVFRTSAMAGQFTFDICLTNTGTTLTATLWTVVNGTEQQPPVGTWNSAADCVTNNTMGSPLAANTDYLFGLTAVGAAGMYSA